MIEKEVSMMDLVSVLGMNLNTPETYDLSGFGLEVESVDGDNNIVYREIEEFLVKNKVNEYYKLGNLLAAGSHRVWYNNEFIPIRNHPDASSETGELNVVDIMVADTQRYIANGQINHNTTSGGMG